MPRNFLTHIDLKGNQLYNVVLHTAASNSGISTTNGSMYYDTTAASFQFRQANAWITYMPSSYTLSDITAPTASVNLNNQKITNLADPSNPQDAANKRYVDAAVNGIDWKNSVRAASTTDLASTFSSPGAVTVTYANNTPGTTASTLTVAAAGGNWIGVTFDTVTLSVGNRILIKNQTTGLQNGIYTVTQVGNTANSTSFIFTRASDADVDGDMSGGTAVWVEEGSQQDTGWVITTDGSIVIGTTASVWTQFSGAGQITAGNGLSKSGNTLSVNLTSSPSGLKFTTGTLGVDAAQLWIGGTNVSLSSTAPTTVDLTNVNTITTAAADHLYNPPGRGSGTGWQLQISGGVTSSGTGGALRLFGGGGTTAGGRVDIDGGSGTTKGAINIGTGTSTAINIGQASVSTTTIAGTTKLAALTTNGFVKTISGDGTLTTDTTVITSSSTINNLASSTSANLASLISDETGTGVVVFGTGPTISLPIVNNIKTGYTTTATSGGTVTLDVNSNHVQMFTGTSNHTVTLPVASTMTVGMAYMIHNNSTGTITVQSSGLNSVVVIPAGASVAVTCILASGTSAASWDVEYVGAGVQLARKVSGTISLTAASATAITHNLNTRDVVVQMWETSSNLPTQVVEMDVSSTSTTQVTVTSSATAVYYYVIIG